MAETRPEKQRNAPAFAGALAVLAIVAVAILSLIGCATKPNVTVVGGDNPTPTTAADTPESDSDGGSGSGALKVHYIDVGQGDSQFIELPDGKTMLIDAGVTDQGENVVAYMENLGHDKLDILVASHPDSDHIGGLRYPLREMPVGQVWAPDASKDTYAYEKFLKAVEGQGLTIRKAEKGKVIAEGDGYEIELLGPDMSRQSADSDANSYSTIIRLTYGDTVFLFTGDAYKDQIDRAEQGPIDVLKVAHHGSYSGTDRKLIEQLDPVLAVIQYAKDNDYGYVHEEVRSALRDVPTYGNGENGTVIVTSDGSDLEVQVERGGTLW